MVFLYVYYYIYSCNCILILDGIDKNYIGLVWPINQIGYYMGHLYWPLHDLLIKRVKRIGSSRPV